MKTGGHVDARVLPGLECLLVVAVEGVERGLKLGGDGARVALAGLAGAGLRHVAADVVPQVAEGQRLRVRHVVRDGDARQLDDAALDRVHQREVADRPGEQRALGVAGAAQEERGGGQVVDAVTPSLRSGRLQPADPEAGGLAVALGLLAVLAGQGSVRAGLLAVAVVGLVVDHDDVLEAHQLVHAAVQHLAFGLDRVRRRRRGPAGGSGRPSRLRGLPPAEGVVVGDDDLGAGDVGQHVHRHQLAVLVVAVGVVGLQDAQAVLDGDAGRHDQEAAAEQRAAGRADGVDGLPGDEHGHDGRLAASGRHLQRDAQQVGVGGGVGGADVGPDWRGGARVRATSVSQMQVSTASTWQKNGRTAANSWCAPVLEQPGGGRRDAPVASGWGWRARFRRGCGSR